jgi:hypothetical protein
MTALPDSKPAKEAASMHTQPAVWLAEQKRQHRQLLLIIDTLHSPQAVAMLFKLAPVRDYIRLFQGTEFEDLLEQSPWLIRIEPSSMDAVAYLLQNPTLNWGWLASTAQLDLNEVAQHWRERLVIDENGQRWFYRFQDNQVIARHLAALTAQQIPLLLGPLAGALSWDGEQWQSFVNEQPGLFPEPFDRPWLQVPESAAISEEIDIEALKQWLWQHHPYTTASLPISEPFDVWLKQQLDLARQLGWDDAARIHFLAEHKLDPERAAHTAWDKQPGETPEAHFTRVRRTFAELDANRAKP